MTLDSNLELGDSWIDQFLQYSEEFPTPYIYRKWCAISAVAACLERRVKLIFNKRETYPNMFVMLIGKPGTGKTTAMTEIFNLESSAGVKLAPKQSSASGLYDCIVGAHQTLTTPALGMLIYHSLSIVIDELAVWMPLYDNSLMGLLCTMWDNPHKHSQVLRTKEVKPIENPSLNMLVGVQPAYLNSILPPTASDQGILARCIMVYTGEVPKYSLTFDDKTAGIHTSGYGGLVAGLLRIKTLSGYMAFDDGARELLIKFHKSPPLLEGEKFLNYNSRRIVFIAKLGMIASAAMDSDLLIKKSHIEWAISSLLHCEAYMPEVYKEMKRPETAKLMAEVFNWARIYFAKHKQRPIPGHRIISVLSDNQDSWMVQRTFQTMIDMKYFKAVGKVSTTVGELAMQDQCYIPVAEGDRDE